MLLRRVFVSLEIIVELMVLLLLGPIIFFLFSTIVTLWICQFCQLHEFRTIGQNTRNNPCMRIQ